MSYSSDPQPHETVLDMCAAPGGKTSLIAQKMMNTGVIIAVDKSNNKIAAINKNCDRLGVTNVRTVVGEGQNLISDEDKNDGDDIMSPPYKQGTFDRILLDAPCSGLGQRPQFYNKIKMKELKSFPKIQKKLFRAAVSLVKAGGVLVYSTCTNNTEENEDIVDWALDTFPNLHQENIDQNKFGHPESSIDTISFFMAKFKKME